MASKKVRKWDSNSENSSSDDNVKKSKLKKQKALDSDSDDQFSKVKSKEKTVTCVKKKTEHGDHKDRKEIGKNDSNLGSDTDGSCNLHEEMSQKKSKLTTRMKKIPKNELSDTSYSESGDDVQGEISGHLSSSSDNENNREKLKPSCPEKIQVVAHKTYIAAQKSKGSTSESEDESRENTPAQKSKGVEVNVHSKKDIEAANSDSDDNKQDSESVTDVPSEDSGSDHLVKKRSKTKVNTSKKKSTEESSDSDTALAKAKQSIRHKKTVSSKVKSSNKKSEITDDSESESSDIKCEGKKNQRGKNNYKKTTKSTRTIKKNVIKVQHSEDTSDSDSVLSSAKSSTKFKEIPVTKGCSGSDLESTNSQKVKQLSPNVNTKNGRETSNSDDCSEDNSKKTNAKKKVSADSSDSEIALSNIKSNKKFIERKASGKEVIDAFEKKIDESSDSENSSRCSSGSSFALQVTKTELKDKSVSVPEEKVSQKKKQNEKISKKTDSSSSDSDRKPVEADSTDEEKKKVKAKKKPPEENKRIISLKKYLKVANIHVKNYAELWKDCRTNKARVQKLLSLLEQHGLKGRPTIEKCKKLRKKIETKKEIAELDLDNIISDEGGRSRRTRRGETKSSPLSEVAQQRAFEINERFSRIKALCDSDSDSA